MGGGWFPLRPVFRRQETGLQLCWNRSAASPDANAVGTHFVPVPTEQKRFRLVCGPDGFCREETPDRTGALALDVGIPYRSSD